MSDNAQLLAGRIEGALVTERAALVLAWLVESGFVEATPTSSGLGQLAHRPGPRAKEIVLPQRAGVIDFVTLRTNGVELHFSQRPELQPPYGDPVFRCPSCKEELPDRQMFPLIISLASPFGPIPEVTCGECSTRTAVCDVTVKGGAFATLAIRFWNWWPLTPAFVAQVAEKCGVPVSVLHEHI